MALIGFADDPRLSSVVGRVEHRDLIDDALAEFIGARPAQEVLRRFEEADAAAALVMDFAELAVDPHVVARDTFIDVDGIRMQNLVARLSGTPGRIRWPGRPYAADNAEVLAEVALDAAAQPLKP